MIEPIRFALATLATLALGSCSSVQAAPMHEPAAPSVDSPARPEATHTSTPTPAEPSTPPAPTSADYCRSFPEHCRGSGDCPPETIDPTTGETIGGCYPVTWVCCGPGGCVAVAVAGACGSGSDLYWSDCEIGSSGVDENGNAVVICHD